MLEQDCQKASPHIVLKGAQSLAHSQVGQMAQVSLVGLGAVVKKAAF